MRFYFQLVKFHKFYRVEQSVVDALTFERDFAVADKVHERTSFENGFALTLFVGRVVRAFHKFFKPFFFQRGMGTTGMPIFFSRFVASILSPCFSTSSIMLSAMTIGTSISII